MDFSKKIIQSILKDFKLLKSVTDEDLKKDEITIYTKEGMYKIKKIKKV